MRSEIIEKANILVSQMTLEEKAGLCSGLDCWNTKPIERLDMDSIMMSDGPHGLRKQLGSTDNLGIGNSEPAVCFPTASALACSFDRSLVYQVGRAIGEECVAEGVSVVLGPGVNMKRSPLCGRNFEYYSEDPILSGELAVSAINGIESTGTKTSLKHFAVNNQEKRRMTIDAVIDERTLREIYLRAFEIAVKKGKPGTVMCSYNKINGVYSSENPYLLTKVLREEWGYEGLIVSDWGAVNNRALGVRAGLDIEMPGNKGYNDNKVLAAIKSGELIEGELNQVAERVTAFILEALENRKVKKDNALNEKDDALHKKDENTVKDCFGYDKEEHHKLAVSASEQSCVLLKNEDSLLPSKDLLKNPTKQVAVIGAFAKNIRYQGAGSSKINPIQVDQPWSEFIVRGVNAVFAQGYQLKVKPLGAKLNKEELEEQEQLIKEACEVAKGKEVVYLFVGLPEGYESEGFDRVSLGLPREQNRLVEEVSKCNPNVVAILIGGAPIELPWIHQVKAVLLAYLGGEGVGKAIVNLLLGVSVPCGKLAETWSLKLEDTSSYSYFPGGNQTVEYRESIYIGYRYYEAAGKEVLFPFGYGLSYSKFQYSNLRLDKMACKYGDDIQVKFTVKNIGDYDAKEIACVFVAHKNKKVFLPKKEMKEFTKVHLHKGESKEISLTLDTKTFGYYNTIIKDWYAESGEYEIMVGASTKDCSLNSKINLESTEQAEPDFRKSAPTYYQLPKEIFTVDSKEFEALYGKSLPVSNSQITRPFNQNHTLEDIKHTFVGKLVNRYADMILNKVSKLEDGQEGMMTAMIKEMPFFAMVASGDGLITESMMEGILDLLNGYYVSGVKKVLK